MTALPRLTQPRPMESAPKDGTWDWVCDDDETDSAHYGWSFHDTSITTPGACDEGRLLYAEASVPDGWLPVASARPAAPGSDPLPVTSRRQTRREVIEALAALSERHSHRKFHGAEAAHEWLHVLLATGPEGA